MSFDGFMISDFAQAVLEKDRICDFNATDKWELVSYETDFASGMMLNATEENWPQPVTVSPKLKGWHRIYLCMADYEGKGFGNHIYLKLSDDLDFTSARAGDMRPFAKWSPLEQVEESFWKAADLTNQDITIDKLNHGIGYNASLLWIRFEPMTQEEVDAYLLKCSDISRKTTLAHMDGDFYMYGKWDSAEDFLHPLYALKDSDVGILSQEITNDSVDFSLVNPETYPSRKKWVHARAFYMKRFHEMRHEIYKKEIEYAHAHGIRMLAAQRMSFSNFSFPFNQGVFDIPFVKEHPELRCVNRDGTRCEFLSYGYREVQDFAISTILDALKEGFDGAELLFSRGICLLFEEPLRRRFAEKYGEDVPWHRIPENDPRVREIRCGVLCDFIERLRLEMDSLAERLGRERPLLYITAPFTVDSGLDYGIDVKALAERGLIDGVVQTKMAVWEEVDDVLAEDGLIDLEKYREKAQTKYVVLRRYGNDCDRLAKGIPQYRELLSSTKVKLYTELQWENSETPETFVKAAKRFYSAGTDAIALWDCYPCRVQNRGEWSAVSHLGVKDEVLAQSEEPSDYRRVHKILSYNGRDMRYYHPSWRG